MSKNSLSVVIVNWNTSEVLEKCLLSLKKFPVSIPTDVYVVDNASSDDSVSMMRKKFPWVNVIANKDNVGFAKANNQILRKINSEFVYIMNPDIEITKGSTDILIGYLKNHEDVAAVGPRMINADGSIQEKEYYHRFPSIIQTLLFYTDLYSWSSKQKNLVDKYWVNSVNSDKPFIVDQLPGASIVGRIERLKEVGYFDERYPLLFEDVDLSYKLHKKGYNSYIIPESKVIHLGGASFSKLDEADVQIKFFRGLFIFFSIHGNFLDRAILRFILLTNLLYLLVTVSIKKTFHPTKEKEVYFNRKWKIAKWLLVS